MGATNHTPNYNLPQFIGTDKPTWLSDVNGAFSDIDTQMKANATSAAQGISDAAAADLTATAANNKANTLDTQINTPSTGLAAVVSGHTTDISGINSDIGSTALPTTAQTLTGAIDELYNSIHVGSISVTSDGTKTFAQLLNELYTLIDPTKIRLESYLDLYVNSVHSRNDMYTIHGVNYVFNSCYISTSTYDLGVVSYSLQNNNSSYSAVIVNNGTNTFSDYGGLTAASGTTFTLVY